MPFAMGYPGSSGPHAKVHTPCTLLRRQGGAPWASRFPLTNTVKVLALTPPHRPWPAREVCSPVSGAPAGSPRAGPTMLTPLSRFPPAARVSEAVPILQQRLPRCSPSGPRRPDGHQTASGQTQQPVLPRQEAEAQAGRPPLGPVQIVGGAPWTVFWGRRPRARAGGLGTPGRIPEPLHCSHVHFATAFCSQLATDWIMETANCRNTKQEGGGRSLAGS